MSAFMDVLEPLKVYMQNLNDRFNSLIQFVSTKLKNYKNLSLGEQIAYPSIGLGLVLILTSIVLFIL